MFGKLPGPLGAASMLFEGRDAFAQRDKQAYPPRLSVSDRQAAVRKAFDERDAMQRQEPDWMKSWGAVGGNAGDLIKQAWEAMQASNAAQAARGASPTPSTSPVPHIAGQSPMDVPLPQPRPQSADTPWWMNSVDMLTAAGSPEPAPAAPMDIRPQGGVNVPNPMPRGGAPAAPAQAYSPASIPGFNPDIPNMIDPLQMGNTSGLKARTIVDPDTGRAMNDFYREDLMSGVSSLLKRAFG